MKEWHYLLGLNDDETESQDYSIWGQHGLLIAEHVPHYIAEAVVEQHNKEVEESKNGR